jgi:ElaB/YqjD/DUF883 family membrane-anchored ribosome-binding protein
MQGQTVDSVKSTAKKSANHIADKTGQLANDNFRELSEKISDVVHKGTSLIKEQGEVAMTTLKKIDEQSLKDAAYSLGKTIRKHPIISVTAAFGIGYALTKVLLPSRKS